MSPGRKQLSVRKPLLEKAPRGHSSAKAGRGMGRQPRPADPFPSHSHSSLPERGRKPPFELRRRYTIFSFTDINSNRACGSGGATV